MAAPGTDYPEDVYPVNRFVLKRRANFYFHLQRLLEEFNENWMAEGKLAKFSGCPEKMPDGADHSATSFTDYQFLLH